MIDAIITFVNTVCCRVDRQRRYAYSTSLQAVLNVSGGACMAKSRSMCNCHVFHREITDVNTACSHT